MRRSSGTFWLACALAACSSNRSTEPETPDEVAVTAAATTPAALAKPDPAPAPAPETPAPAPAPAPTPEPEPPKPSPGFDFIEDARRLARVAVCDSDAPVPEGIDARIVKAHCRTVNRRKDRYQRKYVEYMRSFIGDRLPDGLPTTVVYPFGGGDTASALVAFPNATELTTLSLEHAGDPRTLRKIDRKTLELSLEASRAAISDLLGGSNSRSLTMIAAQRNVLPNQIVMFLFGLDMSGFEAVSMRFFRVEDDGSLHYYSEDEIEAIERTRAKKLKKSWANTRFSVAFSNVEIQFREKGKADAPVRVHRHIAANLDDSHLAARPGVLAHLVAKGQVTALTKAAAYLLWKKDFSTIRTYLLDHMAFMLSDSTGIPPEYTKPGGWKYRPFGLYRGAYGLRTVKRHDDAMQKMWKSHKYERVRYRFGYIDIKRAPHLLFTYR